MTTEPARRTARPARLALAAAIAAGTVLLAAGCGAAPSTPTVNVDASGPVGTGNANGVTIAGTGEVEGKPDTLTISFGVSVKRDTVDAAVNDNAAVATSMLQALIEQGVTEDDVQTRNYSVQPSFTYTEGQAVPNGYQVDNTVTVALRDLEGAGAAIDAVTASGGDAVRVQGVSFSLDDDSEAIATAREKAFDDARLKAEQYATLSGRPLGDVESVAEVTNSGQAVYQSAAADSAYAESTPIRPGEVTTSVSITVRYRFG